MSLKELPKGYEPQSVEKRWIKYWRENNTFTPDLQSSAPSFSIVIPPPNVTGTLHMGHALNITLQDILCRYKRQRGFNVLWIPGTDHAGIATQNVVEKALKKENLTREDLGREEFVKRVWKWKEEYGSKILNQIERLGASVDWTRLRFTMDEGLSKAVREVFVRLYEEGLIYKGDYIINWCPRCKTALADLEVEYKETEGKLYYIKYPFVEGDGYLVVATTRPETMLGDTALAVHPDDERYKEYVGKKVRLPLTSRIIPVIEDKRVEKSFGTGCLKVTPAHDPKDFLIGIDHSLDRIKVIDESGKMTDLAGDRYAGLDRFECRKLVVEDLKEQGFLLKEEKYHHNVGHCYRCQTVIEPLVSKQWFVATKDMAKKAKEAVEKKKTQFFPSHWEKIYFDWMDNIRDWCISRQIWWGHRIPAWYCENCKKEFVSREDLKVCPDCGSSLKQDEDVLDTWFSSALWPFSTLGWPEETAELKKFYPTSVLITGFDIIFFWVARMMMMGIHFMKEVPFRHVYIHALVRDEHGQKMSKSKGNVIDPLEIVDKFGADALRFTLAIFAAMGRDIKLSLKRIEGYRHFMNKIWNAARFTLMNLEEDLLEESLPAKPEGLAHKYIYHALQVLKRDLINALDGYKFNEAAQMLYQFMWHTYCDWYLEMIKLELSSKDVDVRKKAMNFLYHSFKEIIILLHPFIPFITQQIWDFLPKIKEKDMSKVLFPEIKEEFLDFDVEKKMKFFQEVVIGIRNIRSEMNIAPSQKLSAIITGPQDKIAVIEENKDMVIQLARLSEIKIGENIPQPEASASSVVEDCEIFVPLKGVMDFETEIKRLEKQLSKLEKDAEKIKKKLSNENFLTKAPAEVVEKEKNRLEEIEKKMEKIKSLRDKLKSFV